MSRFVVCEGQYIERDTLIAALKDIGITDEQISIYDKPQVMTGWHGTDENIKSSIIIHSRAGLGNSYDIGFVETAEGFVPHIVDMDVKTAVAKKIKGGALIKSYIKTQVLKEVKKKHGWSTKVQDRAENGRTRIRIGVR